MKRSRARIGWVVGAAALVLTLPGSAAGSVTVGETFAASGGCVAGFTFIQTVSPGQQYAIPSAGVLTSWQVHGGSEEGGRVKLKVARPAGGSDFTIVGESAVSDITVDVLNSFSTRLPVRAGDLLGLNNAVTLTTGCLRGSASYAYSFRDDDPLPGATNEYELSPFDFQLNVAAVLEPDADGDGFGDETQDRCPSQAATQGACAPPDTNPPKVFITKDPPKRTHKSKVRYRFASEDPTASFECKLKGNGLDRLVKQFNDCTSPRKYKRLDEGKFKFQVRATDPAGNVGNPAKDKFKVVD